MSKRQSKEVFTAIDLFSGAGGLTIGLKRAGFKVVAAVEIDGEITKTYQKNHPEVKLLIKDIRNVKGDDLLKLTGLKKIDLVAGCPPCQGFSKLTDKCHKRDNRNELVLEMARLVSELKPAICMMENVPGLAKRGFSLLKKFEKKLELMGYVITKGILQMADYGVPQSRRRLVLLAGKGFKIPLPDPTHSRSVDIDSKMKSWITLKKILKKDNEPVSFSAAKQDGGPGKFNWHIVRDLKPISIKRLKFLTAGGSRLVLPKKIRPTCHKNTKGFQNVYGRMNWDSIAPTITSGCVTLSAGRFGHPRKSRTISVREAATIQTFPNRYIFNTDKIDVACMLIGNALPPRFAKIVSLQCYNALIVQKT